jgi:hypothetical protein
MKKFIQIELLHPELTEIMVKEGMAKSKGEWRRLVEQNAIDLAEFTLKVGKRKFIHIK